MNEKFSMAEFIKFVQSISTEEQLQNEDWLPLKGFEDEYYISSYGRIISLPKTKKLNHRSTFQLRKLTKTSKGYLYINLCKDGKKEMFGVHRLVLLTFSPVENTELQVNHKNGKKDCNLLSNLEWVTPHENIQHAHDTGLCDNAVALCAFKIRAEKEGKKQIFRSMNEASRQLSISYGVIRDHVINGKPYKGYTFTRID
jgi:hypothetical protein